VIGHSRPRMISDAVADCAPLSFVVVYR